MALVLADRVYETSTTVGTITLTLNGALDSYQTFSTAIGNGNTCYYTIAVSGGTDWEVGIGTVSAGALARTTVLSSSNANALVNLPAGTKNVFVTYPAEKSVNLDASGEANIGITVLSDVTLASPSVNQVLGYNGATWTNVEGNSASAGPGVVFYNATPSITAVSANNVVPILTLATIPVTTAEQTLSGTAVSNTVLFSSFISAALGRTLIDAGVWSFTTWIGVDSVAGGSSTYLTRQVYTALPFLVGTVTTTGTGTSRTATASSGTPFATGVIDASATNTDASYLQTPQGLYQITARSSDTVVTITTPNAYANESAVAGTVLKKLFGATTAPAVTAISPAYQQFDMIVTAGSYAVTALTELAILGFVTSDATRTITIPYNGTERNTHVNSPLANLHNDLNGLQGGSAGLYYHLTSTEYTGTGTLGTPFVRQTSPSLITPALGTPTSGNISNCTSTSMVLTTPVLGTPTSGNISNCTSTSMVLTTPVLGTPTSGTLTNCTGTATSLNIGGNAATATLATNATTAANLTTASPIYRNAAGAGYLNGQYGTYESGTTTGPIYSIGGSYVPTSTTLGTMYGIGYGLSGNAGINVTGAPTGNWGMYVASNGVARIGLQSDTGAGYFSGLVSATQYFSLAGTASVAPQQFTAGTNLTTIVSGATEYDGTNLYFTQNSASKRGVVDSSPQYVLSANGAGLPATISPFFTSASTIPLLANSNYLIEAFCFFLKTGAGATTWTHTLSGPANLMHSTLEYTPIAGFTTALITGAMILLEATQGTVTTMAFPATGILAINTNHIAKIKLNIRTTAAVSYTLNLTQVLTCTPLAGSYQKVTLVTGSSY